MTTSAATPFHRDTCAFFAGKTVLVTGGSGFIGSHVVDFLAALDAHTVVPTRTTAPVFLEHHQNTVRTIQMDLEDPQAVRAAMDGVDITLHLAADVGGIAYNMAHPASIFTANMKIALNVLEAARQIKMSRLLLCSSACVYPRICTIPTPEEDGFKDAPEPTNAGYGWAKRMLEFMGLQYAREHGLDIVTVRPYNAYGPRDHFDPERSHVIPALIVKALEAGNGPFPVWGDGSATRSFVYAGDFARGIIEGAARLTSPDPVNIGSSEETTIADLASLIADGVKVETGRTPYPVFQPEGAAGQPRRCCDTRLAKKRLGFEAQTTLRAGLQQTIRWYLNDENSPCLARP